jgi:hypothetical protein
MPLSREGEGITIFFLNLDLSPLISIDDQLKPAVEKAMAEAARRLTAATHAHLLENVQNKLHSTRQKYIDALQMAQISDQAWVIVLEPQAFWIEDGLPPNRDMTEDLLKPGRGSSTGKNNIRTARDGSRYRSIPFQHNKPPTQQTPIQKSLTDAIKSEMKARKIPYGKLETDTGGQPKEGLLHSFDVVRRGKGAAIPVGKSGVSLLQNVRVYQKKSVDRRGKETIQKGIFTFRTVSSKHAGSGKWVHPGLAPRNFMEDAYTWALAEWTNKIGPETVERVLSEI